MKFIFIILLILLLLNISCKYIIGKDEEITIKDGLQSGIVYVKLDNFSNPGIIYVDLKIDKGGIYDYIEAEFSDTQIIEPRNFSDYYYYDYIKTANSSTYYYKIHYKKYNYMIFKYHLNFSLGTPSYLKVKATDDKQKSKIFMIIFTVIGCIISIGIPIFIIVSFFKKKKRKNKDVNTDGTPNIINPSLSVTSQESFVNNNNDNQRHFPKYPESY